MMIRYKVANMNSYWSSCCPSLVPDNWVGDISSDHRGRKLVPRRFLGARACFSEHKMSALTLQSACEWFTNLSASLPLICLIEFLRCGEWSCIYRNVYIISGIHVWQPPRNINIHPINWCLCLKILSIISFVMRWSKLWKWCNTGQMLIAYIFRQKSKFVSCPQQCQ